MVNDLVSMAYILTRDEFAFFRTIPDYETLTILGIDEMDRNIVRDATSLMSLEAKGFVHRNGRQLSIEPSIHALLQFLSKMNPIAFELGKSYNIDNSVYTITSYPLQLSSFRITIERSST